MFRPKIHKLRFVQGVPKPRGLTFSEKQQREVTEAYERAYVEVMKEFYDRRPVHGSDVPR